eukprot:1255399-Amphidinium_carterae.1
MDICELRQGGEHIRVSRAKTPLLIRQCLLQLQLLSYEHLLQMQLPLNLDKKILHSKCIEVLCTPAGLVDLQGALGLLVC